jgi:transposase-like protein
MAFGLLSRGYIERKAMSLEELEKKGTLYEIAKILGITASSAYKWRKIKHIPPLRLYELKEKKPEWFK